MPDPETPARTKAKRKQSTANFDPEEVAEKIIDDLERSREGMDKKLAKYSDSFLRAQSKKRQRFIDDCESRISGLPKDIRSSVATTLLTSEDFAMRMNFSELHTSSAKASLTWSCGDVSLSDPSWRRFLQQYAEDTGEYSSPSSGELARTTRATRMSSSPPAPPSTPVTEAAGLSNYKALAEAGVYPFTFGEDQDELSISYVTISKTRRTRNTEHHVAPPDHEARPKQGTQEPFGAGKTPNDRKTSQGYFWTEEETDTLREMCEGRPEALRDGPSTFWESVQSRLPRRTQLACWVKWRVLRGGKSNQASWKKKKTPDDIPKRPRKLWSQEELTLLGQFRPRPGKPVDWKAVQRQLPGRSVTSITVKYSRKFGKPFEYRGTERQSQSSELPDTVVDEQSVDGGDMATKDDETSGL